MRTYLRVGTALLATIVSLVATAAYCQQPSPAEQTLANNAEAGRYTLLVFYKQEGPATQSMLQAVKQHTSSRTDEASVILVPVGHPSEKRLVEKLGISRAPMPLCVVMAANGAVTGLFQKAPSAQEVANAFVTPTMLHCMKAMQDGKIVLISVERNGDGTPAAAVTGFQADPHYQNRVATVSFNPADPRETDFLKQLDLDADNKGAIATILLAPPGVLVGKYKANASHAEMAEELAAAGKCCDDPNCKHHKHTHTNAKSAQQNSGTRRN
jgi:hypothetical protein